MEIVRVASEINTGVWTLNSIALNSLERTGSVLNLIRRIVNMEIGQRSEVRP